LRLPGQGHRIVRNVYGQDAIRRLRGRLCGAECSARRGTALGKTQGTEAKAVALLAPRGDGGGGRATARLRKGAQETVARLRRRAGRQAARFHDQRGRDGPPRAVACEAPGSCVKNSRSVAQPTRWRGRALWGPRGRAPRIASGSWRSAAANGPPSSPGPWDTPPKSGGGRGISQRSAPRPLTARRGPAVQPVDGALGSLPPGAQGGPVVRAAAGHQASPMGRGSNRLQGGGSSGATCGACMAQRGCRLAGISEATQS
jgi:hypothetical protein